MLLSLLIPAVPPLTDAPVAPPAIVMAQDTATTVKPGTILSDCEWVQTPDSPNGQLGGGITCCCAI